MRIKMPEEVTIFDTIFKIKQEPENYGGSFSFANNRIIIGTKKLKKDPDQTFRVICHEVMEICTLQMQVRYDDASSQDNYKFFMDHKEFDNVVGLFSKAIQQFIK